MKRQIAIVLLLALIAISGCNTGQPEKVADEGAKSTAQEPVQPPSQGSSAGDPKATAAPSPEEIDADAALKNTALFETLSSAGILDAAIDVQNGKILIAFDLPGGMDTERAAYFAIGAAANISEGGEEISIEVFSGDNSTVYSVGSQDAKKFISGEMSEEEFGARVRKS
ncbi:MAG TPA: hypothetical protein HA254_07785 [Candidatus Diapherotrites archaeon]|uniref:Uncharacterized protein n=1 Tax=Candidatus Iainarchaeum sp. TaxID=3101447 RepID=A0A7J4J378_9ARCH|nr:hypothetical protein [Candidatus Diapherotrites archaeon]